MADSGLPHFRNSKAAKEAWEPIYLNQFGIEITFPTILQTLNSNSVSENGYDKITFAQQVTKLSGLPEITPLSTVEQYYKFAKRTFAAAKPEDTTAELELELEVNLNNANEMYAYNMLRAWSNIIFDPATGSMGLKSQYIGSMVTYVHNKRGNIIREVKFPMIYPIEPLTAMELDWSSEDLYKLTIKFKADYFEDKVKGLYGNTTTTNALNGNPDVAPTTLNS